MTSSSRSYWEGRLRGGGIGRTGRIGLSDELNETLYAITRRTALGMLRAAGGRRPEAGARALDVGAGWGFWLRTWHDLGFERVDATDFVPEAVEHVRSLAGKGDDVREADVTQPGVFDGREPYAMVSCMNVLLHVLDDTAFTVALANLAGVVAPGGLLLLAEPAALGAVAPRDDRPLTSVIRPLAAYVEPLRDAGLELVAIRPALSITGDPIEIRPPLAQQALRFWWRAVRKVDRVPILRRPLGWTVRVVDGAARRIGLAETSKLLLFRRTS